MACVVDLLAKAQMFLGPSADSLKNAITRAPGNMNRGRRGGLRYRDGLEAPPLSMPTAGFPNVSLRYSPYGVALLWTPIVLQPRRQHRSRPSILGSHISPGEKVIAWVRLRTCQYQHLKVFHLAERELHNLSRCPPLVVCRAVGPPCSCGRISKDARSRSIPSTMPEEVCRRSRDE